MTDPVVPAVMSEARQAYMVVVGVTFTAGARTVVMGGTAAVLDALRPASVVATA